MDDFSLVSSRFFHGTRHLGGLGNPWDFLSMNVVHHPGKILRAQAAHLPVEHLRNTRFPTKSLAHLK